MYFVMHAKKMKSLCAFVMAASIFCGSVFANDQQKLAIVDRALPTFSLLGVDGQVYDPQTLKGKTWLINFWAIWCAPCLEELPSLNNAWAQLKDKNVGMLAINIGEDPQSIQTFLTENNIQIDFPIVIGSRMKTLGNWSVVRLPHTVIVNPAGRIVYEAEGDREWDDQRFIDAIVALNDVPYVPEAAPIGDKVAQAAVKFQALSPAVRAVVVFIALFVAIYLFMLVSMRRRN